MADLVHDTKRRVLFLIPTLRGGGAERVIATLLKHLDHSKFRLSLAIIDSRDAVFLDQIPGDVEIIDFGLRRVRYALPRIVTLIWRRQPDVVFSTLGHLNLVLAMIRKFLPGKIRYIARETTVLSNVQQDYRFPNLWARLARHYYNRVDLLVCQSSYMQQDLVDNFSFPQKKSVVIHNPIDAESILGMASAYGDLDEKDSDLIYLVAAGRLSPEKGFDLLVEAMALLGDQRVQLDILGEGPLLGDLKQLSQSKGVDQQVHFVGFQPNPYAWFARADGFVLSSRFEGFPNVVLEALTCGTPVIATPAPGGVREILDDIPECLVAKEVGAEALAKAISDWIAGPRRRVPGTAIEPYRLEKIIAEYEEVLIR